jgi:flagellar hook protein FlgE
MGSSLNIGVTGLVAHRRMLDVVGNNLANVNSIAFKAQRALFTDLLYETLRPATGSSSTNLGGTNPVQIGSGVKLSQVDREFSQGSLDLTGGDFDFAISGDGFFAVSSGAEELYTRAGAFALDSNQRLIDPSTGFRVLRQGTIGEPTGNVIGFQTAGDDGIVIPLGATIPGEQTTMAEFSGNLTANAQGPAAAVLTTGAPFQAAGVAATASTLLNDLDKNTTNYSSGDSLTIDITDANGTDIPTVTFPVDGTTTLGDLVAELNTQLQNATASIDASGNIVVTADNTGTSPLRVRIEDTSGQTGATDFETVPFNVTTVGKDGDVVNSAVEFYDSLGRAHTLRLAFQRTSAPHTWEITGALDPSSGSITTNVLATLEFNDNGSFARIIENGNSAITINAVINGISTPQAISLDFGDNDSFTGITQASATSSPIVKSDGFRAGELSSVGITADGVLMGISSNGRSIAIAQLAMANFLNPKGLEARGDSYFAQTSNSGQPQRGAAGSGGRGRISAGQLETSNVDIAQEFTRLIIAQRGFSANARTITVSDEVLQELTQIIR